MVDTCITLRSVPAETQVMEMSGLYGPYTCHEHVLQRIWAEQEFTHDRARTTTGDTLEILDPGKWNLLGGPDFRAAKLSLGGRITVGDVEVHFHASDWEAHGHHRDAAYANVILHVVLFPPGQGQVAAGRIPTLVLLPLLLRDLEEIASDAALRQLTGRLDHESWKELDVLPLRERALRLCELASARWEQKVRYATRRIQQVGWPQAAHQTALEILGYRFNRAQMIQVAERHALEDWKTDDCADRAYRALAGQWRLQGVRPANHPKVRLHQYSAWVRAVPDWPDRLMAAKDWLGQGALPEPPFSVLGLRRQLKLGELRRWFAREIAGQALGGTRLDNLVCDGLLPLIAARAGADGFAGWFCWPLGDAPSGLKSALRSLGLARGRDAPACHGWGQGLLGWMLQVDLRANR